MTVLRGPLPRGLNARVCPYAHGQANARLLAEEPIIPLSLAAVVRVRLDRTATTISPLVIIGVRTDGQKILLRCAGRPARSRWCKSTTMKE